MHVVVTGAAGFIGSHLCERLLAAGHEVTGIDAFTRFYERRIKESNLAALRRARDFRLHDLNLLAGDGLPAAMAGADAVVHLAGRPGVRGGSPEVYEAGNVATTEAVVHATAHAGLRRVLLASSSSVYGSAGGPVAETAPLAPLSPYGHSKARAEAVASALTARLRLELVTLRYFTVYGPRQRPDMAFARYLAAISAGEPMPVLGDGRQARDFTYVGDAVTGTLLALERGRAGATYNVSGGRSVRLDEAFELLAHAAGAAPEIDRRPADGGEPRSTAADLGRARAELGYEPSVPLEDGLRRQAEHAVAAAASRA